MVITIINQRILLAQGNAHILMDQKVSIENQRKNMLRKKETERQIETERETERERERERESTAKRNKIGN